MVRQKPQNPRFSDHAEDRWYERVTPNNSLAGGRVSKWQAWNESIPFAIPDHWGYGPNGTIHPPTDVVFIWGEDPVRDAGYAIATVLRVERAIEENGPLTGTILFECVECGHLSNPVTDGRCRWCAEGY